VVSLGLAYWDWVSRRRVTGGQFRSARRHAHGWVVVAVCFLCSALAVGAEPTGRTAEFLAPSREEPASVGTPAGAAPHAAPAASGPGDAPPRQVPDSTDRTQRGPEPADPGPPQPAQSASGSPDTGQPVPEEPGTGQPDPGPPTSEEPVPEQPDPEPPQPEQPVPLIKRPVELSTQPGQESVDIDGWQHVAEKAGDLVMDEYGIYTARGAKLSIVDDAAELTYDSCAQVQTWTDRVEFSELQEGSLLCAQSSGGRLAMLRVRTVPSAPADSDGHFVFYGKTWEPDS
jgi:hypothetical protein